MSDITEYSGKENLSFLEFVPNYVSAIESLILSFLGEHKLALDFGAGSGTYLRRLSSKGLKIDSVEIDEEYAAKLNSYKNLADVLHLYARIYSCDVIEHIEDDVAILKQLHAKLTDDGKIFIYVPAFNILFSEMDKRIGHYRRYTKSTLLKAMKAAGFKIERAEYVDSIGFFGALYYKYFGNNSGNINSPAIYKYYKYIFPVSRVLDNFGLKHFFGKNLLVTAYK